ncbi:electron transfer flavoprotein alpha subunit [Desulfobaculum xiamenense]|uniref:Electron transfer flavoprotein alpha subunit n=1 Tax=Desulfobaculum xiamenense TaxID=995050 RepID=A0A846QCG9_9BACT|nr:FAD-binding protein [Desulfobaculum xiamenense]NJB66406.1 electron transfer flavoprotein alpha subunit [Desulfobaculum xiamenense]
MSKISNVWVFSDAASRLPEVIAGAAQLGEKVSAFVLGSQADVARAFACGADAVYHLGEADSSRVIEAYADSMAAVIAEGEKPALVLMPSTRRCKGLASLLGVRLEAGVVTEAAEIAIEADGVLAKHMVFGGLALGEEKVKSSVSIVVVGSGVFAPAAEDASKTGEAVSVAFVEPKASVKCIERRAKQGSSVDLNKAKRVVSIGRGIAKQEDIKIAEDLCAALGAELGCSRPIAEGEQWMERERYVGISGVMPKPEVYLALGISGQIQHMVGVNGAQVIVAVNKDKNAPIFQFADYGIVGDLYKVVPALINAFKA